METDVKQPMSRAENGIYQGDCRELAKAIPDESVDLIFTDPPYAREYLPLYEWTARAGMRILKPGGFVLVMCGGMYVNQIFRMMDDAGLAFYWQYNIHLLGGRTGCNWVRGNNKVPVVTRTKPVLAYSKGDGLSRCGTLDLVQGTKADKRYHAWGQDEATTRYYVDCFSAEGDIVLDPFCGGGTTPAMCKQLGRRWLALEQDPDVADTARDRVKNMIPPLLALGAEQMAMVMMPATDLL